MAVRYQIDGKPATNAATRSTTSRARCTACVKTSLRLDATTPFVLLYAMLCDAPCLAIFNKRRRLVNGLANQISGFRTHVGISRSQNLCMSYISASNSLRAPTKPKPTQQRSGSSKRDLCDRFTLRLRGSTARHHFVGVTEQHDDGTVGPTSHYHVDLICDSTVL